MTDNVGVASPWLTRAREVYKLFEKDPEVTVEYDNDGPSLKLRVANTSKSDALSKIMPQEMVFGNVTLTISVIPANEDESRAELFRRAFAGNPAVADIETIQDFTGSEVSYVIFQPEVVQFPNDNIGDIHGYSHMLFETIAKEVFDGDAGIHFCTDLTQLSLGTPLGEWP